MAVMEDGLDTRQLMQEYYALKRTHKLLEK